MKALKNYILGYNVDTIKITVDATRLATEAKSKQIKIISKDSDFSVDDINLIGGLLFHWKNSLLQSNLQWFIGKNK